MYFLNHELLYSLGVQIEQERHRKAQHNQMLSQLRKRYPGRMRMVLSLLFSKLGRGMVVMGNKMMTYGFIDVREPELNKA